MSHFPIYFSYLDRTDLVVFLSRIINFCWSMTNFQKTSLWLDCDPGVDDAYAIILAAYTDEFKLIGLSTVIGNASVQTTTNNALKILWAIGLKDIPCCKRCWHLAVSKCYGCHILGWKRYSRVVHWIWLWSRHQFSLRQWTPLPCCWKRDLFNVPTD